MKVTFSKTQRGFPVVGFQDRCGAKCSIQKSSLADEDAIWIGIDDPDPQIMARDALEMGRTDLLNDGPERYNGWVNFPIPDKVLLTTRMHLNKEQVATLLPLLQHFLEHGELPERKAQVTPNDHSMED